MSNLLFFGYGANRAKAKLSYILKCDPGESVGAIAEGYVLGIQNLKDIPEPAQSLMKELYGTEFKAYSLVKGNGTVTGILWELSEDNLDKLKDWEFVGSWRELVEIEVKSSGGKLVKAWTEKSMDQFPVVAVEDGIDYSEFNFEKKDAVLNSSAEEYYTTEQIKKIKHWLDTQAMRGFEQRK